MGSQLLEGRVDAVNPVPREVAERDGSDARPFGGGKGKRRNVAHHQIGADCAQYGRFRVYALVERAVEGRRPAS
jgi:hypothetical protein